MCSLESKWKNGKVEVIVNNLDQQGAENDIYIFVVPNWISMEMDIVLTLLCESS